MLLLRRRFAIAAFAALFFAAGAAGQATRSWNRIRYQGGTIAAKVNPFDWNTTLTLQSNAIELNFAGRKKVSIPLSSLQRISYGQPAHRRVSDLPGVNIPAAPVALFGLLQKGRERLLAIEFQDAASSQPGAVLLSISREVAGDLIASLATLTGRPVENWP